MFVWWLTFFFTLLIDLVRSFRGKKKCNWASSFPPDDLHSVFNCCFCFQATTKTFSLVAITKSVFLSATGEISQQNKPESNDSLENMINFFFLPLSVVSYRGCDVHFFRLFILTWKKKRKPLPRPKLTPFRNGLSNRPSQLPQVSG